MKIAVGSDEKTTLTEALLEDLRARGHELVLFGPLASGDPEVDWPLTSARVAEAVAGGRAEQGVVCCWTGTGASIAANKVRGIRAALCHDAETARGARLWNHANVLALSLRATSAAIAKEILEAWFATAGGADEWNLRQIDRLRALEERACAEVIATAVTPSGRPGPRTTPRREPAPAIFPPFPAGLKGRRIELAALERVIVAGRPTRIALVGGGGSGKSMLACALGHRVKRRFPGGIHWFRSGPWDASTLSEMMAIRFGTSRERGRRFASLRRAFAERGPTFVVLDNHENDLAASRVLNELEDTPLTWVVTARRCLLGGIDVFPVVAPLSTSGGAAFPRVRALSTLLRHSPLALAIADGLVGSGAIGVGELRSWLVERGVQRVRPIDHEDDLPEVIALVAWVWPRLDPAERRVLAVLSHTEGDHVDEESLLELARVAKTGVPAGPRKRDARRGGQALGRLRRWRIVDSPLPGRFAVHAVVRYAVSRRTRFEPSRSLTHYLALLERFPERLDLEQTHLYAAMDYAQRVSNLGWMLRIERLLARMGAS
jgi:RpiB/LacA/LacB family sugar-phosphate isomerase